MANSTIFGPVNLGNTNEINLIELIRILELKFGRRLDYVFHKSLEDDPQKRKPDINLAKIELIWIPIVDIETGL
jgi:UDP-glucuronate decarboxylase